MLTIEIVLLNKKIAVPYKNGQTIEQLINDIVRRAALAVDDDFQLYHNDCELYIQDTLEDLGIKDNDHLQLKQQSQPIVGEDSPAQAQSTTTSSLSRNLETNLTISTSTQITKDLDDDNNNNSNNNNVYQQEIKQIDMIVLDLSGSMTAPAFFGSTVPGELEMRRIEVAQTLFQTLIDKYVQLEVAACVGLVCFGERIELTFPPTRSFDSFSTELGEVVANQSKTRLYEAIRLAAETIVEFRKKPSSLSGMVLAPSDKLICRVFALTDGQDNSNVCPYQVYQFLKQSNIVLDAIPIGCHGLGSFTKATGGSCFTFNSSQAGVELFEREAVINLATRSNFNPFSTPIANKLEFNALAPEVVTSVQQKVDAAVHGVGKCSSKVTTTMLESSPSNVTRTCRTRIIREYQAFTKEIEQSTAPAFTIFMAESNIVVWKIVMKGPAGTAYEGLYLLSMFLPDSYPFQPPKVKFETKVYHCNIDSNGNICLDILKDKYNPQVTIHQIMLAILSLLQSPNPLNPIDPVKAGLFRDNPTEFWNNARLWNKSYANLTLSELKQIHSLE